MSSSSLIVVLNFEIQVSEIAGKVVVTAKLEEKERQQLYCKGVKLLTHLRRQGASHQGREEVATKKGAESFGGWARDS